MKIQFKLMLLTISMTVFAMVIALFISSSLTQKALEADAIGTLSAVLEARHSALVRHLDLVHREMHILAASPTTTDLLGTLSEGYARMGKNAQTLLQQNYLAADRDYKKLNHVPGLTGAAYDLAYSHAETFFLRRRDNYEWQDMYLVDPHGNVVFSIAKQADFATNLVTGPWKDTGLARAVTPLLRDAVPGAMSMSDFSHYAPNNNRPASFIAMPMFDAEKQLFLGVVAIQLPVKHINDLMRDKVGLGESGETFVVGKDGWMLTDSRFRKESSALGTQLRTEAVSKVLAGESGVKQFKDYRGIDVYVAYKPLQPLKDEAALGDHPKWGVIAKMDKAEVLAEYYQLRLVLLLTGGGLVVFAFGAGLLGSRGITRPLLQIKGALAKLARGESADVPCLERRDELGEMAKAAEAFREMAQQVEHEHWVAENVTSLTGAVSAESSVDKATDKVLHLLCERLDVPVGAIYLLYEGRYQRVGAHGLARRSQAEDVFQPGEGVLGQCAKDNQAVVISPVPSGLSIISTGLAEFPPHELVLYPIAHKNEVLAVLELAAAQSLEPRQHEFLKAATEALGLHLANLQASEHNLELLAETRKQSAELRTSSLYARSLLESSLDPLVTIGPDGKIMDVNVATENVTGVKRDALVGSDFSDYFTDPEMAKAGYKQVFTQGYVTDYSLAIRHPSGKITDVLYNASVFRDARGEVAGIFAAARDVTEKKKAELKMREQQDELLRSNEEMHAMTEELRSQSEEMKAQNEELRANQEELRAQQEEMKQKNLMLETQSVQLKELLQETESKAQDLQRANQYKSEFLANMSHELRTPLNSVLILSKNLAENQENNLSPDQIESATVISESGAQLLTLINDILDLSKIEAGKLELVKEEFRLDDMLAYLRRIFSPQAEKKQLDFNIQVAANLPETIHSDRQRLTQVLSNLLSNAVKFTDSGEVKVRVSKADEDLQFEVIDSGIGISPDKLEHIFGAFQQADGSTSRKYGGSGLGLAISRHLTELLGGEVRVDSQPGKGSQFTIRLLKQFAHPEATGKPEARTFARQERRPMPGATLTASAGGSILVVEDDTRLLSILERMIKTLGFTPLCVGSAEQALLAIDKAIPDGILLDLGLPKMSGMELLRRLKADKATAQVPVFIMSGATDSGEAKVLGALGFLKKPVTRDTIAAAIRTMAGAGHAIGNQRVLLVDNNPADAESIGKLLGKDAVEIVNARTGSQALELLQTRHFDTVILDLELPDMTGFEWLKQAAHSLNPPPAIIYSARELSEDEVFGLKEMTESIVTKSTSNERLHEEVLLALHLDNGANKLRALASAPASGKKLLLVDDDARNLFALTKVLRAKGYGIEVAPDGAKALEMLALGAFDAVLTDIMMPEMDGYALIRQIRALGHTDIPIFAITAKAMQGDAELCLQAGATAYLSKPVDVDRLVDMIEAG